jgi:hypothetical protein
VDIEPQAQAACEYAEMGYRVFPVHGVTLGGDCTCQGARPRCPKGSPGKHPRILEWPKAADTDRRRILEWWLRFPRSNVAVLTGEVVLVADFDGQEGRDLADGYGILENPEIPLAVTGSGVHAFHRPPAWPVKSTTHLLPGLDVRARDGYVVVPPSRHATGRAYEWRRPLPEPSRLPAVCPWYPIKPSRRTPKPKPPEQPTPWGTESRSRELLAYSCTQVRLRREGDRNDFLFREACHFAEFILEGRLTAGELIAGLYSAALESGLEPGEIDCTISSALRRVGVDEL